jgi:enamine deaminase RidA (YjgF/YER057c/UK114 family)
MAASETPETRLRELGISLPAVPAAAGCYVPVRRSGGHAYVSGQGPVGEVVADAPVLGKVGADLTLEQARHAAYLTGLNVLAALRAELGSLDRVTGIVKVLGMVNAAPGFNRMPEVIDGCSELFVRVFGAAGRHARSAVGLAALPFDIAVEIEVVAELGADG